MTKKWKPREGILHSNPENSLKVNNLGQLLLTMLFKVTMWSIGRMPKYFARSVITGLVLFGSEREHLTLWTETMGPTICHIFMIHFWRHQLPRGRYLVAIVGNRGWINHVNSDEVLCPRAQNLSIVSQLFGFGKWISLYSTTTAFCMSQNKMNLIIFQREGYSLAVDW